MERHRLSPIEVESIATAVTQVVPMERLLSVRLFGSRANIDARGGDIDLWVVCAEGTDVDPVLARQIRRRLEDAIGPQKIDMIITGPLEDVPDLGPRAFLETISPRTVELWNEDWRALPF